MDLLLQKRRFREVNLDSPFFDSLKSDYQEFETWFRKKADNKCLIFENEGEIQGFLYLKEENHPLDDVTPPRPARKRLKIGTFKIDAHGTKLGERLMKKIFDMAIEWQVEELYVTVFPKHQGLISLFAELGFSKVGVKTTHNGTEEVWARDLVQRTGNLIGRYPFLVTSGVRKYLLAIKPEFHSRLFPDSILNNESYSVVRDLSHTNSIHKVYVGHLAGALEVKMGDLMVIYRTTDIEGRARFRSVATSIAVIEEVKSKSDFSAFADFFAYCKKHAVFDHDELLAIWNKRSPNPLFVFKMSYNAAFSKRVTRGTLMDELRIAGDAYWGFIHLNDQQFDRILQLGGVASLAMD